MSRIKSAIVTTGSILWHSRIPSVKRVVRWYTIQPPDWLGGKNLLIRSGRWDFPEHAQTFEDKMKKMQKEIAPEERVCNDIGITAQPDHDRSKIISVANANRKNKELEQAARHRTLTIPLIDVEKDWRKESAARHIQTVAEHYGIYQDMFDGDYFTPVVNLYVCYDYDDDLVTPVYYGNRIFPAEAKHEPTVRYAAAGEDTLYTLMMTNPDGHLFDNEGEYIHWLIGNIPGSDVSRGEKLVDYIQPFPVRGTGAHRFVFVLFEQNKNIDYGYIKRPSPCTELVDRAHRTVDYFSDHRDDVTPVGLAFFQSEWDDSVRHVYHHVFNMAEPSYEYAHPPPYHPTPRKYPHKEPFDRYFDRYRDKKDIAEEVLSIRLDKKNPFTRHPRQENYPLIHRAKSYKPSWLKLREERMHLRREQYKDLP